MAIPTVMIELGRPIEMALDNGDEYEFPKNGKFILACPKNGKGKLFIFMAWGQKTDRRDKKAQLLYRRFNGKSPNGAKTVDVTERKLIYLGRCVDITYESDKYGRTKKLYIHDFHKMPTVRVDSVKKPRFLVLSGDSIKITSRGILG